MSRFAAALKRFVRHAGGATAAEYGLLVALLSVVVIGAVRVAGVNLFNVMSNLSTRIAGS